MNSPVWQLCDGGEIPELLSRDIAVADERIAIQAMHMSLDDEVTRPILDVVADKARRQPDLLGRIILLPDGYSLNHYDNQDEKEQLGDLADSVEHWKSLGIKSRIGREAGPISGLGPLKKANRNHQKIYVADDVVTSFGGCNFTRSSFYDRHDFMMRTEHEELAKFMFDIVSSNFHGDKKHDDFPRPFGPEDLVIVDGGRIRRSMIRDIGIKLVGKSVSGTIRFASLFKPGGLMREALEACEPQLIAFNKPEHIDGPMHPLQKLSDVFRPLELPAVVQPDRMTHAKCITGIAREDIEVTGHMVIRRGQVYGLSTSNNFHGLGVLAGTNEIGLLTTQEHVVDAMSGWMDDHYRSEAENLLFGRYIVE